MALVPMPLTYKLQSSGARCWQKKFRWSHWDSQDKAGVSILPWILHFECVLRGEPFVLSSLLEVQEILQGVQPLCCPTGTRDAMMDISMKPGQDRREDEKISGSNMPFGLLKKKIKLFWVSLTWLFGTGWSPASVGITKVCPYRKVPRVCVWTQMHRECVCRGCTCTPVI